MQKKQQFVVHIDNSYESSDHDVSLSFFQINRDVRLVYADK